MSIARHHQQIVTYHLVVGYGIRVTKTRGYREFRRKPGDKI